MNRKQINKAARYSFETLKKDIAGILSMTDREDFISKIWSYALIKNPRIVCNSDIIIMIDFDFNDISVTISWSKNEKHPTLIDYVDLWIDGQEEPVEVYVGTKSDWYRYITYLKNWAEDHTDEEFEGCSPVGYDEFCDNELQEDEYEDNEDNEDVDN